MNSSSFFKSSDNISHQIIETYIKYKREYNIGDVSD